MKIAFLLTGKLRFQDQNHLVKFLNFVKGGDLFINTYESCSNVVKHFDSNIVYHKFNNDLLSHAETEDQKILNSRPGQFNQWYLLSELINFNIGVLEKYDLIVKIRPDLNFTTANFFDSLSKIDANTFYCSSDWFFYSKSNHFLSLFAGYWQKKVKPYIGKNNIYLSINYKNLLLSDLSCIRYRRLFYPESLFKEKDDIRIIARFKNIVADNLEQLSSESFDKLKVHCIWPYYQFGPFSSEKFFAKNVSDNFISQLPSSKASLMNERYKFSYLKNY